MRHGAPRRRPRRHRARAARTSTRSSGSSARRSPAAPTSDCPAGSHCDDATHRCAFSCLADSDCGDGQACDAGGSCVRAPAASHHSSRSPRSGCQTIPVPDRLAALAALTDDPLPCFGDEECPCGAYCANDATCHYDCLVDNATSPPFCDPGLTCSPEGRCIQPDHSNDPTLHRRSAARARPPAGPTPPAQPSSCRPRCASAPSRRRSSAAPANAKVTLAVRRGERDGGVGAGAHAARALRADRAARRQAATSPAAGSWARTTDPLLSQPRQVWVELPQRRQRRVVDADGAQPVERRVSRRCRCWRSRW